MVLKDQGSIYLGTVIYVSLRHAQIVCEVKQCCLMCITTIEANDLCETMVYILLDLSSRSHGHVKPPPRTNSGYFYYFWQPCDRKNYFRPLTSPQHSEMHNLSLGNPPSFCTLSTCCTVYRVWKNV